MNFLIKHDIKEVTNMNIGNNISLLRKSRNLMQEELAAALGVSAQAVSKWENNSSCPDVSLLTDIADFFSVSVDELLRSEGDNIILLSNKIDSDNIKNENNYKKNVCINVTQPDGKKNTIRIPFSFVKTGLKIGRIFGLDEKTTDKISELANGESIDRIVDIDTEKGEHITINLE